MTYAAEVLADSPLLYWKLDEVSGTTADNAQGNASYDGTYTGDFTLNQVRPIGSIWTKFNSGAKTGRVQLDPIGLAWPTTALTIECWYYDTSAQSGGSGILSYAAPAQANEIMMWWQVSTTNSYQLYIGGTQQVFTNETPGGSQNPQCVKHVVMTWDTSGVAKLYVNGELVSTKTGLQVGYSIAAPTGTGRFMNAQDQDTAGGGGINATDCFMATMGHVAVYATVLSDARIKAHYNAMIADETPTYAAFGADAVPATVDSFSPNGGAVALTATITVRASYARRGLTMWVEFANNAPSQLIYRAGVAQDGYGVVPTLVSGETYDYAITPSSEWDEASFTIHALAEGDDYSEEATKAFTTSPGVSPGDAVDPVVTVISTSPIKRYDPWIVDVTDDQALAIVLISVTLRDLGTPPEVAFDGVAFTSQYSPGSTKVAISGGFRFTLHRADGWISSPSFSVLAVDTGGNLAA